MRAAGAPCPMPEIPLNVQRMADRIREDMMLTMLATVQNMASSCTEICVQHLLMLPSGCEPVGPDWNPGEEAGADEEKVVGAISLAPGDESRFFQIGDSDAGASSPRGSLAAEAGEEGSAAGAQPVMPLDALMDTLQEWPLEVLVEPTLQTLKLSQAMQQRTAPRPVPEARPEPEPPAAPEQTADAPAAHALAVQDPVISALLMLPRSEPVAQKPMVTAPLELAAEAQQTPMVEALPLRCDALDAEINSPDESGTQGTSRLRGDGARRCSSAPAQACAPVSARPLSAGGAGADSPRAPVQVDGMRQLWEVVGGGDCGGILVREGRCKDSLIFRERLCTGSLIEEINLEGYRLHFRGIAGTGPKEGWISVKAKGKDLAVRTRRKLKPRRPPPEAVGLNSESPLPVAILFRDEVVMQGFFSTDMGWGASKFLLDRIAATLGPGTLRHHFHEMHSSELMLFVALCLTVEKIRRHIPHVEGRASVMMGTGLGLLAALCAAEALTIDDGLRLAQAYTSISEVPGRDAGCTLEVRFLDEEALRSLLFKASKENGAGHCEITAFLGPQRFRVGGAKVAVRAVRDMARKAGAQAVEIRQQAWGTKLMQSSQAIFSQAVDQVFPNMKPPVRTIWMPGSAEPLRPSCDCKDIADELKEWITVPSLVSQSLAGMREEGISEVYFADVGMTDFAPIRPKNEDEWAKLWCPSASASS